MLIMVLDKVTTSEARLLLFADVDDQSPPANVFADDVFGLRTAQLLVQKVFLKTEFMSQSRCLPFS